MGMGDALMTTGEVKRMHEANGRPVHVVGIGNKTQWSPIFEGNPRIARTQTHGAQRLFNGPGIRPYIQAKNSDRWYWRDYSPIPGEVFLTEAEQTFAEPYAGRVVIEPNVKVNGHRNKSWLWERWQEVADSAPGAFVQCGPVGTRWLNGVIQVETPSFRHACAVLERSRAFVGTEGGLHHAAAAFCVHAVVLWSEFIAPGVTGYQTQINIRHAGESCGARVPCGSCAASMKAISVDEVVTALEGYL